MSKETYYKAKETLLYDRRDLSTIYLLTLPDTVGAMCFRAMALMMSLSMSRLNATTPLVWFVYMCVCVFVCVCVCVCVCV